MTTLGSFIDRRLAAGRGYLSRNDAAEAGIAPGALTSSLTRAVLALLVPTSARVMNFVRMSASVSCFLSIALLQGSHSFANANDSCRWWRIDRR
jgi:hypothetical protein